jgi:hypothetical protein
VAQQAAPPAANANADRAANAGEAMIKDGSHTLRYGGVGPLGVEFYEDDQPLVLTNSVTTFRWQGRQIEILNAEQADLSYRVEPASAGS